MALSLEFRENMGFLTNNEQQTVALQDQAKSLRSEFFSKAQPEIQNEPDIVDGDTFTVVSGEKIYSVLSPIDPLSEAPTDFKWQETEITGDIKETRSHRLAINKLGEFHHFVTTVSRDVFLRKLNSWSHEPIPNPSPKAAKVDSGLLSRIREDIQFGQLQPIAQEIR